MPLIPEETIDRIDACVDDLKESIRAQTQALLILNERVKVNNELLAKVHEAVTKPADGDALSELLKQLVEADQRHSATLQQMLAAVRMR